MYQRQDHRNYGPFQLLYVHQQECVSSVHNKVAVVSGLQLMSAWSLVDILLEATKEVKCVGFASLCSKKQLMTS